MARPIRPEAQLDVGPAELGDRTASERMRHRVRVKRHGRAWLHPELEPIGEASEEEDERIDELMPVIGETASRIRVVTEEDGVRVAIWIDRRDAWETVVAPVKLGGGGAGAPAAPAAATAGVWLEAGAPVEVTRGQARGTRGAREDVRKDGRVIELRDEAVAARGWVTAAFVGHVWTVPHDDETATDMEMCAEKSWHPPADSRPWRRLAEGAPIRAAADAGAPVLATPRETLDVVMISRAADWADIELRRPYTRIRGFVQVEALSRFDGLSGFGGGCGGGGYMMAHADRIEVPAGTCLFDRANGDVIGAASETRVRRGRRGGAGEPWSMVYASTRWAMASLYVRDTGRDPAGLSLESCAAGAHR